jgi:hypothetical protein
MNCWQSEDISLPVPWDCECVWADESLALRMSRKQLEALGYSFVESDLPAIVREWCVGDSVLCLVRGGLL